MNLLIGDSHILALQNYNNNNNNLYEFSAASIRGLLNNNSKSHAGNYILNLVNNNNYENLFIMFGKVDLEWVYPYKCKNAEIDITDFINDTIDKYIEFIKKISSKFKIIYIMGLHLPSLPHDEMINCINSYTAISDVSLKTNIEINFDPIKQIGSLKKRTKQIILFNKLLKNKINNINNYKYIDITDELLDKTTNICKKEFQQNRDHHLKRDETGLLWYQKHLYSIF